MMQGTARGSFVVQLTERAPARTDAGVTLGQRGIDKQFEGDLLAHSVGEMLSAISPVAGSAGYVAIEQVIGSLHGRQGSFVLQHSGQMQRGRQSLQIDVVADSASDDLRGLQGQMQIEIRDGVHYYIFDYQLPDEAAAD